MHFKSSYSIFRALVCILFGINKRSTEAVSGVRELRLVSNIGIKRGLDRWSDVSKARVRQNMLIKNRCNRHRLFAS